MFEHPDVELLRRGFVAVAQGSMATLDGMTGSSIREVRVRRWVGVVCVVVLLVAACGGGDATDTSVAATEPMETAVDCRGEPGPHQLAYEIPGPNDVEVTCDLVYKAAPSGIDQTLDVFVPAETGSGEALPTVIFFHFNLHWLI